MPHSYPRPNPPYPYIPKASKRPTLPSIASSSVYLTPIQEQRILSWRSHAGPPSPLDSSSPRIPTPGLTTSASASTGTPLSDSLNPTAPAPQPAGKAKANAKAQVKSAPASLVAPASGSQCRACGGSCGCSTISRAAHSFGPITSMSQVPAYHQAGGKQGIHGSGGFAPSPGMSADTGTGTGIGSRQRSYYSTKKYRQAKVATMRDQNGYGNGAGMTPETSTESRSASAVISRGGMGRNQGSLHGQGQGQGTAYDQGQNQGGERDELPAGTQPEWPQTQREPSQVYAQAAPIANPTPRIGGARDPISQNYWRNMYPPVGGPNGINSGMPVHMMGMGMGLGMGMGMYDTANLSPDVVIASPPGMKPFQ